MTYYQCKNHCCPKLYPLTNNHTTFIVEDDYGVKIDIDIFTLAKKYASQIINPDTCKEIELQDLMTEKIARMTWEQFEYLFITAKTLQLGITNEDEQDDTV